ncbi:hypothetical protein [Nitrosomonas ureae]|uniref:Uncharacterized protein n=1 Tax=Nitrosomonas ureae TaxID=44577 RepID=A0A1H9AK88_9PROT|nr:hypothetical protein [Nitrosomonas ureae]SEP76793.1 hypothetical protein SAMN05421510_10043 [Nitrosomonas ureae]
MKSQKSFGADTSSSAAIRQQIEECLYDLGLPSEALYIQLYQALVDEHQSAIDGKQQEMNDLLRNIMANVHMILSLGNPDNYTSTFTNSGSSQTIRALIHRHENREKLS